MIGRNIKTLVVLLVVFASSLLTQIYCEELINQPDEVKINDFCYLSIKFEFNEKTCACFLVDEGHVVTSANCLVE